MSAKILVIGSGGREHAICWKLAQSGNVEEIYALPGSYGIGQINKVVNLTNIDVNNFRAIGEWCQQKHIDLVVIGPEDPLAHGISDVLSKFNIRCFGPMKEGAQIESDKKWAKNFMMRHNIPTARFDTFTESEKAKRFLRDPPYNAVVVKASGLAAGKGVVVALNSEHACEAVDEILKEKKYGKAGDVVVIEELLIGEEISVLAFVDKNTVRVMLPSQDHKRLQDHDLGPNTGGMGAYCPCPLINENQLEYVIENILQKTIDGLRQEGISYCGVLYAGLMLTDVGPKVLEFNCRFGDPETQVILPLLKSDLYDVMLACCDNKLNQINLEWAENLSAVGVVMASAGYPETSTKDCVIEGIPKNTPTNLIFHSGVAYKNEKLVTNGGRVLIAVSLNEDLEKAASMATEICHNIKFLGNKKAQYRTDIAAKAFKLSLSYKDSGVDIEAGDDLVQRIKPLARGTCRQGVVGGIGGFGGLFSMNELPYKNPVLCEITGGVESKIKLALDFEMYEGIGYDLVAVCVNKVLESGAEPIAFLDYIACGKLQVSVAAQIIKGISEGCRDANCALLGGETAEMPTVYAVGKYDMAGYCVGVLEENFEIPKYKNLETGDMIIALPTCALNNSCFGFVINLLQKLGVNMQNFSEFGDKQKTFASNFLETSPIYVKEVLPLIQKRLVKSLAYVDTDLTTAMNKLISKDFSAQIDFSKIRTPDIFGWMAVKGGLSDNCLLNNFNCGIGMLLIVSENCTEWMCIPNAKCIGKLIKSTNSKTALSFINVNKSFSECSKQFSKEIIERNYEYQVEKLDDVKRELMQFASSTLGNVIQTDSGKILTKVSKKYRNPILIIGTDGVGTKIKIAQDCNLHNTVGIDLVAMCANDILCNGAEPLTFLSYYAGGEAQKQTVVDIISGVVEGSKQSATNLIDTQIVELPLIYKRNVYDLAGFSLGVAEYENMLPRTSIITEGDIVIGLPSTGVHSNGFSLVHKIMDYAGYTFGDKTPFSNKTFGEEFLTPTKIYVDALKNILEKRVVKAIAHITGGGLIENIPRVFTSELGVILDANNWNIPPVFAWLAEKGNITFYEMQRTYNCGLGLILIADPKNEEFLINQLKFSHNATKIGNVVYRKSLNTPQVTIHNFEKSLQKVQRLIKLPKKRVAVLISGSGTNLQSLINATNDSAQGIGAEIVMVISNKSTAYGLERAKQNGIDAVFISHKDFSTREEFDEAMSRKLKEYGVDIVCLAGFMRILTENFVKTWKGKLINIHPSLLPKHPGLHVQKKALDAGDSESGCTIHFVDEGVDTGAIIIQEKVPILPGDTEDILSARILKAEHFAFPKALKLLATDAVKLVNNKAVFC
ncbi:trifunctional purine biosynthetic protein adenosine-3 [Condylostylus longicornis]|uniref:trifunctional purine biosynthetic protein adenosine-3 n=1 Tax=Condylostylus longicornis TaxID=2530218 RepID=UPI00244DB9E2|nr:trifunctional purine biosynthetic protein adenosine-3 [Condylostylus longicornis]